MSQSEIEPTNVPRERFKGERSLRARLANDFEYYSANLLKILSKGGGLVPFELNKAQKHIHSVIEEQLERTGRVRVLVLKARQQGCSTLTAGRFYRAVTHRKGVCAYVLSHAMDTTKKLFAITRRYHNNMDPLFQASTTAASANEYYFNRLESTYHVGTAGAKETGRGGTIHYFHGSEVAFWPDAEKHFAGVMQSIPTGMLSAGTEIILESTANGPQGKFYEMCMDALKGEGEYELIFTPWYWQDEYAQEVPNGWDWTKLEDYDLNRDAQVKYGLSMEQVYWMHLKRKELGSDWLFRQEYPGTVEEAFQTSGEESFLSAEDVEYARVDKGDQIPDAKMNTVIGALDPAGSGKNADRSAFAVRNGRRIADVSYIRGKDSVELAETSKEYIDTWGIEYFVIDVNGLGVGVYDVLKHDRDLRGVCKIVPVNYANSPVTVNPDGTRKYANKKAELYDRMRIWLQDRPCEIPNKDELRIDLTTCRYSRDKGYLEIESKKELKQRGAKSPDGSDVCVQLFEVTAKARLRKDRKTAKVSTENYNPLTFGLT